MVQTGCERCIWTDRFRVVEELLETGISPRMLMRQSSVLQISAQTLSRSALICSTLRLWMPRFGCRCSRDRHRRASLCRSHRPLRVDAWGVQRQVEACRRVGVQRVILVSSLCAGRLFHPSIVRIDSVVEGLLRTGSFCKGSGLDRDSAWGSQRT